MSNQLAKRKARSAIHMAIVAGRIVRPDSCEDCGKASRVHGHHPNYDEPLSVEWLCPQCHRLRHRGHRANPVRERTQTTASSSQQPRSLRTTIHLDHSTCELLKSWYGLSISELVRLSLEYVWEMRPELQSVKFKAEKEGE